MGIAKKLLLTKIVNHDFKESPTYWKKVCSPKSPVNRGSTAYKELKNLISNFSRHPSRDRSSKMSKEVQKVQKSKKDEVYLEERIDIPKSLQNEGLFSWRKLWLFTGPGWLSKFIFFLYFFIFFCFIFFANFIVMGTKSY